MVVQELKKDDIVFKKDTKCDRIMFVLKSNLIMVICKIS
jgi:hypothetical protein